MRSIRSSPIGGRPLPALGYNGSIKQRKAAHGTHLRQKRFPPRGLGVPIESSRRQSCLPHIANLRSR
jgi:hypothetical protein